MPNGDDGGWGEMQRFGWWRLGRDATFCIVEVGEDKATVFTGEVGWSEWW